MLTLHADRPGPVISPALYGHFAEHLGRGIYEGIWVGPDSLIPNTRGLRHDVVAALKHLCIPVLRWPGGCFADEYHWEDGIGPRELRPAMYNSHWGGVVENNHFGTHEFMDLVELLDCDAYICGNVGSGSVQEMKAWVEYLTSDSRSPMANLRRANGRDQPWRVKYFGVGNESWGCGGNMTPEYYADLYKRYNSFVRNYAPAHPVTRIACGPNGADYTWTETLMKNAARHMDGLALHYYTIPTGEWAKKGSATEFEENEWFSALFGTLRLDEIIRGHLAIMDRYDPQKRVGLVIDEWGTWYDVEPGTNPGFLYQQNTLRDALVAALNLHIFHAHADRISMANLAQTVNVLQAVVLTEGEKLLLTPTYHVFELFKVHQGATTLAVDLCSPDYTFHQEKIPVVSASASRDAAGNIHLSLINTHPSAPLPLTAQIVGAALESIRGRILTAPTLQSHNTFAAPNTVQPQPFTAVHLADEKITLTLPAKSILLLTLASQ